MKEKKVIVSLKGISKTYDNDVKVVKQNHHAAYDSWL